MMHNHIACTFRSVVLVVSVMNVYLVLTVPSADACALSYLVILINIYCAWYMQVLHVAAAVSFLLWLTYHAQPLSTTVLCCFGWG